MATCLSQHVFEPPPLPAEPDFKCVWHFLVRPISPYRGANSLVGFGSSYARE